MTVLGDTVKKGLIALALTLALVVAPVTTMPGQAQPASQAEACGVSCRIIYGYAAQHASCLAAITAVIASTAIPVAKVIKVVRFVRAVGNIRDAATLLIRVARADEQIEQVSPTLASMAGTVLGVGAIRRECS